MPGQSPSHATQRSAGSGPAEVERDLGVGAAGEREADPDAEREQEPARPRCRGARVVTMAPVVAAPTPSARKATSATRSYASGAVEHHVDRRPGGGHHDREQPQRPDHASAPSA